MNESTDKPLTFASRTLNCILSTVSLPATPCTWFHKPGPPTFQHATLKSWEWAWGWGYTDPADAIPPPLAQRIPHPLPKFILEKALGTYIPNICLLLDFIDLSEILWLTYFHYCIDRTNNTVYPIATVWNAPTCIVGNVCFYKHCTNVKYIMCSRYGVKSISSCLRLIIAWVTGFWTHPQWRFNLKNGLLHAYNGWST